VWFFNDQINDLPWFTPNAATCQGSLVASVVFSAPAHQSPIAENAMNLALDF
jgi:hypothetical protein